MHPEQQTTEASSATFLCKGEYVRDLAPGRAVRDVFVIADARQATAKNGPYWSLVLADATGEVPARIWSPLAQEFPVLESGQVVVASARVETFRDQLQLMVDGLEVVSRELSPEEFCALVPSSEVPSDVLYDELCELLAKHLKHKPWKTFVRRILGDEEVKRRLLVAPGGKAIHHAYAGGLLEHTLAVCKASLAMAELYPGVDREVLLVAAAFHDIGKAWELTSGLSRDFTDEGRLLGHIQLGMNLIEGYLARAKSLDAGLALHLRHCLLSHHGELAFGSAKRPKTREAYILHLADNLDSKMNTITGMLGEDAEPGAWSPYVRSMERFLYKPVPTPGPDKPGDREPNQCLLPLKG